MSEVREAKCGMVDGEEALAPGCVYVLRNGERELFKIGRTSHGADARDRVSVRRHAATFCANGCAPERRRAAGRPARAVPAA